MLQCMIWRKRIYVRKLNGFSYFLYSDTYQKENIVLLYFQIMHDHNYVSTFKFVSFYSRYFDQWFVAK